MIAFPRVIPAKAGVSPTEKGPSLRWGDGILL